MLLAVVLAPAAGAMGSLPGTGGLPAPAIFVNRSRDGGRRWSHPVYVDRRTDPLAFDDHETVTANRYRRGAAYVVWRSISTSGG